MTPDPQAAFLRQASLSFAALGFCIAFVHMAEQPFRPPGDSHLWLAMVNASDANSLFRSFVNGLDLAALLAASVLAMLIREAGPRLVLAFSAAFLLFFAHLIWSLAVSPVQSLMTHWTAGGVPADFAAIRNNFDHAQNFVLVLKLGAIGTLYFIPEATEEDRLLNGEISRQQ